VRHPSDPFFRLLPSDCRTQTQSGEYVASKSGKTFDLHNPATEEFLLKVSEGNSDDIDAAVAAAEAAFPSWAAKSALERSNALKKLAQLIRDNIQELGRLEGLSMGIPISQYPLYANGVAASLDHFAGLSRCAS
jgi:aldehyde dehydrogenase (NAD+)